MDLTECDREPIEVPGAIQPHGVLLVLDPTSEVVVQFAGDTASLLGFEGNPIGRTFAALTGVSLGAMDELGLSADGEPLFLGSYRLQPESRELDILGHFRDGRLVLELEPSLDHRPSAARLLAQSRAAVSRIKIAATTPDACSAAAREIAEFSGYARVLVYQFLDDGSGKVIAEQRSGELPSLLNQHFPASDIPRQARELYRQNPIRVIPAVGYTPAALEPRSPALDMSACALRSVSPVHLQYLRNMGVSASMSVSILKDDELWGLIACHHHTGKLVPYEIREVCKNLAVSLTQQLETTEARESRQQAEYLADGREQLLASLAESGAVAATLHERIDQLMKLIPADGIILSSGGELRTHGTAPPAAECASLISWVRRRDADIPFATDALPEQFERASTYSAHTSGILSITATQDDPLEIIWLRREYRQIVEWAGHPHKSAEQTGALTPRASFELWREVSRGRSRPWTSAEIEAARRFRDGLERVAERQRLSDLQVQLIQLSRASAMGAMASTIAHELNQPLTSAGNFLHAALLQLERSATPSQVPASDLIAKAAEQTQSAGKIVRHLRQLVANNNDNPRACSLSEIVQRAVGLGLLGTAGKGLTVEVEVPRNLVVAADGIQIEQVLLSLIRNAVEAMEEAPVRRLRIKASETGDGFVKVAVSDSGAGLQDGVRDQLFAPFVSSKKGRLGVGLSICRTIIEAHGGILQLERGGDATGATFAFTLPSETASG